MKSSAASVIEPLETRIAPAAVFTFNDVDGDKVTVTLSKGTMANISPGYQFTNDTYGAVLINLGLTDSMALAGANLTISAAPQKIDGVLRGDGHVNVGVIDATGISLGAVKVDGDLAKILSNNLKSLSVASLGEFGTTTGATDTVSSISGSLGALKVAGNIRGYLYTASDTGAVTVGGSLLGGAANNSGALYAAGSLTGPVVIKGNVVGGGGTYSGSVGAGFNVGNVTILGSLLGGIANNTGTIYNGYENAETGSVMGAIKIVGDVQGGRQTDFSLATDSGVITSQGPIASVTIGGSLRQHLGLGKSGSILAQGNVGSIKIGGDVAGGASLTGDGGGRIDVGDVKTLTIGGSLRGGIADDSGAIKASDIANLSIRGDMIGGEGEDSGKIIAGDVGNLTIGGALVGGNDPDRSDGMDQAGTSGRIFVSSAGSIKIGLGIVGGNASFSGTVEVNSSMTNLTIGGSIVGGLGGHSGSVLVGGKMKTGLVQGDLIGFSESFGDAEGTGSIDAENGIDSLTITGSVIGGAHGSDNGRIQTNGPLGKLIIGGDLRGGGGVRGNSGTVNTDTGSVEAQRIGSITIGGSIIAGVAVGTPPERSGFIFAEEEIGSITVKGSLIGTKENLVKIYAGGAADHRVANNFAIKSLTVGGDVENAWIFGGVNQAGALIDSNAQIGKVSVGGDWIASSMTTGASSTDGVIGDGDDSTTGTAGKIASIIIGGQVIGRPGTTETFGIFAREIGAMKVGGVTVPLIPGPSNDLFLTAKAKPLGSSLSPHTVQKPDGFAVHVYEV